MQGYSKYAFAGLSVLFCALYVAMGEGPLLGFIAALAMLNECFLPKAIRVAHLPQKFLPAPKPALMPSNANEKTEVKIESVNMKNTVGHRS